MKLQRFYRYSTVLFIAAPGLGFDDLSAQTVDNVAIYNAATRVADDIELIREIMGRPYDDSPRLPASQVSQTELYFQSQTLFRKANQLAQDFGVAEREPAPVAPVDGPAAADTFALVEAIAAQIALVKAELDVTDEIESEVRTSSISETGVFMLLIDISRQLNLMIEYPIQPRDVYRQVSLAASFAAGILNARSSRAKPALPTVDGNKSQADVYRLLLLCIDETNRIARPIGVPVVTLSSRRNIPDDIEPGHVYDIATILVADLASVAVALDADGADLGIMAPKHIFPTQVYGVASLLLSQLQAIDQGL